MKRKVLYFLFLFSIIGNFSFAQREFKENIITYNQTNVSGLFIADINKDNQNDIISTSFDNDVAWWENKDNAASWTKHIIDNTFNGALYVYVSDINNDSFADVIVTGANTDCNSVVWYKNNGTDFETWDRIIISDSLANGHGIYAGDIDNDGDVDVIATSQGDGKISWFENIAGNGDGSEWAEHIAIDNFPSSQAVCVADINNDGNLDIIGASSEDNLIKCLINSGEETIQWTEILIDDEMLLPHWIDTIDMDNDGDVDIYAAGYFSHEISWYENDLENEDWIKHKVITGFAYTLAVCAGDLDNDNDIDFVGTTAGASKVIYCENNGDNISFERHTIGTNYTGAWPVYIGDLNNDDYLDVVAGAQGSGKIAWFKNDSVTAVSIVDIVEPLGINITVFPNPANEKINIKLNLSEKSKVDIGLYDFEGSKIKTIENNNYEKGTYENSLTVSEIIPGIYFLRFIINNHICTKKIIIS